MKNYVQAGVNLTLRAPAAVSRGNPVLVGSIFGIVAGDAELGADMDLVTEGVFEMNKVSTLAIGIGDKVYFDAATGLVNKTVSGNTLVGVAVTAAANPSGTVNVRLNGAF